MSEDPPLPPYVVGAGDVTRDRETVLAVWRGNLGDPARMGTKYDWFYRDCPYGAPLLCILRHRASGAAVGVAAAGPRNMQAGGRALRAGVLVDMAVMPEHRSLGPALVLQQGLLEAAATRFDLVYGFPNPKAVPVFKRVGYTQLADMVRYARVLRHARYLERRMPRMLARLAGPLVDIGVACGIFSHSRSGWKRRPTVDRLHPPHDVLDGVGYFVDLIAVNELVGTLDLFIVLGPQLPVHAWQSVDEIDRAHDLSRLAFKQGHIFRVQVMNANRENAARDVAVGQADMHPVGVGFYLPVKGDELILPGKTLWIAVGLGNNGNNDQALQFPFQAAVDIVRLQEAVVGILVEIDGDIILESRLEFLLEALATNSVNQPSYLLSL